MKLIVNGAFLTYFTSRAVSIRILCQIDIRFLLQPSLHLGFILRFIRRLLLRQLQYIPQIAGKISNSTMHLKICFLLRAEKLGDYASLTKLFDSLDVLIALNDLFVLIFCLTNSQLRLNWWKCKCLTRYS